MNKEELIQFLKENLKISIYAGTCTVEVTVYLGEEKIAYSEDDVPYMSYYH